MKILAILTRGKNLYINEGRVIPVDSAQGDLRVAVVMQTTENNERLGTLMN